MRNISLAFCYWLCNNGVVHSEQRPVVARHHVGHFAALDLRNRRLWNTGSLLDLPLSETPAANCQDELFGFHL